MPANTPSSRLSCLTPAGVIDYRRRAEELNEQIPVERNCEDVSFCGCLEAITSEGGGAAEMIRSHLASALRYAGRASTQGI